MSAHAQLKSSQLHWSPPPPSWSQPPEHETDVQRTPGIGSQAASGTGSACALHAEQTAYGAAGGCSHENKRGWMDQNMARIEREGENRARGAARNAAVPRTYRAEGAVVPARPVVVQRTLRVHPCRAVRVAGRRRGEWMDGWVCGCVDGWVDGFGVKWHTTSLVRRVYGCKLVKGRRGRGGCHSWGVDPPAPCSDTIQSCHRWQRHGPILS